jgi:acetyl-CoA C-acetyltransferase
MPGSVIVSSARTPIGKLSGSLAGFSAMDLGGFAIKAALERGGVGAEQVDYVVMGQVLQAGQGQITARQAALKAGIPMTVPAITINKVCLSGLNALYLADQMVQAGDAEVVVAGGMESMTTAPYLLPKARSGYRMGHGELLDVLIQDGLWCAFDAVHMGSGTERYTGSFGGLTREAQDDVAARSHDRATAAMKEGRFADEIVPVEIPQRKGDPLVVDSDEPPRPDTSLETLAKLRPAFAEDGTVTAGNASGINDGAAALLLASDSAVEAHGWKPLVRIVGTAVAGVEPRVMGLGPIEATRKVLGRTGLGVDDLGLVELNEAFAAQSIACIRELGLDTSKVNVNGGAIALGHPLGCSGARILTTLAHEMVRREVRYGLATMCIGVGQGIATVVERV